MVPLKKNPEESQLEVNSMLCCKIVLCFFYCLKCKCLSRAISRQECNNVSCDFCDWCVQFSVLCNESNITLGFSVNSLNLYLHNSWNCITQTWLKKKNPVREFLQCLVILWIFSSWHFVAFASCTVLMSLWICFVSFHP